MYSPRYSSTGTYSTYIMMPSSYPSYTYAQSEFPESTGYVVTTRISEAIASMPSKGWLGKRMIDALNLLRSQQSNARTLAERCWSTLIRFDSVYIDFQYRLIATEDEELQHRLKVFDRCWEKCVRIVKDSGLMVSQHNPAYLRSRMFDTDRFFLMSLSFSLEQNDLRRRWIRAMNLLGSIPGPPSTNIDTSE